MTVMRRGADNAVQFASFLGLGLLVAAVRRDAPSLLAAAALAVVAVRAARNGLYVGDDAVVVRNTFRTDRVPRDDIERVTIERAGLLVKLPVVVLRRRHDRPVPLWCLMPGGRGRAAMGRIEVMTRVQKALGIDPAAEP
jgi:hypothetical protein